MVEWASGHRDLEFDELHAAAGGRDGFPCGKVQEQLPDTELRMIVGMAQGADLLVAQTALALGVGVEAVLPMPLEQYAADFDAETLASLRKLLQHPDIRCDELLIGLNGRGVAAALAAAASVMAMYANLTETFIRRCSRLLKALWDGRASSSPAALPIRCFVTSVSEPTRVTLWNPSSSSRHWRNPTVPSRWCTGIPHRAQRHRPGVGLRMTRASGAYVGENALQVQHTMPSWLKKSELAELNS